MAMERRGPAVCSDSNKKEGKGGMIKIPRLSLPNMVTAAARYGFGWMLLGQLLFADGARFSHHVRHGLLLPG